MNELLTELLTGWPVFRSPLLERIQIRRAGVRCVVASNGKPLFSMDNDDVKDLIDTLQKYLVVSE